MADLAGRNSIDTPFANSAPIGAIVCICGNYLQEGGSFLKLVAEPCSLSDD